MSVLTVMNSTPALLSIMLSTALLPAPPTPMTLIVVPRLLPSSGTSTNDRRLSISRPPLSYAKAPPFMLRPGSVARSTPRNDSE